MQIQPLLDKINKVKLTVAVKFTDNEICKTYGQLMVSAQLRGEFYLGYSTEGKQLLLYCCQQRKVGNLSRVAIKIQSKHLRGVLNDFAKRYETNQFI
jgi:hypothetical protein